MAVKKHLLHLMLVLSIGLLPMLNVSAMSMEHAASAPMDCIDCDRVKAGLDGSCLQMDCSSVSQSCGSHTSATYLPVSSLVEVIPFIQIDDAGRITPDYRQNLIDPIFRPPIA